MKYVGCLKLVPLIYARDSVLDEPRVIKRLEPQFQKLLLRLDDCSRPRNANLFVPLLDPRPLQPRLDTVHGVGSAAKWVRATRTANSENELIAPLR